MTRSFRKWFSVLFAAALTIAQPSLEGQEAQQQPFTFISNFSSSAEKMPRGAVISLTHGGGPMPVLGDPKYHDIVASLTTRVPEILRLNTDEAPRAIVIVTAHWRTKSPTVSGGSNPSLYYDYGGFPEEAYRLKYDAPGSPDVAQEVYNVLKGQGFSPGLDKKRGWDHGVFVPMILIHPKADVPIVQLSVLSSEDPDDHFRMGVALEKLRDKNIAIIGSGFPSFHNTRLLFSGATKDPEFRSRNEKWNDVLVNAVADKSSKSRLQKLKTWREFPGSYEMHPQGGADHFMPTIVCAGAVGDEEAETYADEFMFLDHYSFYWR